MFVRSSDGCSSVLSFILRGKKFTPGHCAQTFQPNSFIPTMLIGAIDFSHLIPLSVTLTWLGRGGGSQGQHKVETVDVIFLDPFQLNE